MRWPWPSPAGSSAEAGLGQAGGNSARQTQRRPPPPTPLKPATKPDLRRRFRQRRLEALPAVEAAIQAVAQRELPGLLAPGRWLGLYWPLAGEADLRGLSATLPGQLALPAIEPGGAAPARMVYRPWHPATALRPDATGIPAPPAAPAAAAPLGPERMALLLAPALACDGAGIRLGYGGGWFDRLRADPAWAAVPTLAVLPAACRLQGERLPRDPWDVPLQGWLDEGGLHWLQPVSPLA